MVEGAAARALRLLDLVPYLVSHPGISVARLAEEFQVSKEEILKDLNLLFMCGLPGYTPLELIDISFDDDVVVVRDPQNLSTPRNLTESESLALRISLAALLEMTPKSNPIFQKIQKLIERISSSFSAEIPTGSIEFVLDREKHILETIEQAIREEVDVTIEYINKAKDERTERVVSPNFITIHPDRSIFTGYCHLAKAERSFVISQVISASPVTRSQATSIESTSFDKTWKVKLLSKSASSDFLLANKDQLQRVEGDTYHLEVFNKEWIIRSVLSEPETLELREPLDIRQAVKERALYALGLYGEVGSK